MASRSDIREALCFDDVLIAPQESAVKPSDVSLKTRLTRKIELGLPLAAAPLPGVTESIMAIALARLGGIGIIHDKMPLGKQVEEVRRVKRAEGNIISSPITISPESSAAEAFDLMNTYKISGLPVIDQSSQKVVGIITGRDTRFLEDYARPVKELMSKDVITAPATIDKAAAKKILHENRIEKLVLVDAQGRCAGMITVKDMERLEQGPNAARDAQGRLRVGAAVGVGKDAFDRAAAMTDAGVDVIFVDIAHGHTKDALATVSRIRQQRSSEVEIVAGNVATLEAARSFIDAGADAIKVGVGQSCCSALRGLTGVGVPQLAALLDVAEQCAMQDVPVIAAGGVRHAADIAKALAAGAGTVVLDHLFFGTDEAPGEIVYRDGQAFKLRAANAGGVADPYHVAGNADLSAAYRGPVAPMVAYFVEALRVAMAYAGSKDIKSLHGSSRFVRVQ